MSNPTRQTNIYFIFMIVKVVRKKKKTSSFSKLAKYIARTDKSPENQQSANALSYTNCFALDSDDAILEIVATQDQNQTTKADKTYHMIVSFPLGERPETAVLCDIEKTLVAEIGLGDYQRISAIHSDTSYLHLHIVINKIHPITLAVSDLKFDYKKLQSASRQVEVKYDLQKLDQNRDIDPAELITDLRNRFDIAIRQPKAKWNDIHALLAEKKLQIKPAGRGLHIVNARGESLLKASEIGREFSKSELEKRLGAYADNQNEAQPLSQVAEAIERCGKVESFQTWSIQAIAEPLRDVLADSHARWNTVHELLATNGLYIIPSGRGLTITNEDRSLTVKPSQIGREFSKSELEKRLGAYEVADDMLQYNNCPYGRRGRSVASHSLWEDYCKLKVTTKKNRKSQYETYTKRRDADATLLKKQFARAREAVWSDNLLSTPSKRDLAKKLSLKRKEAYNKLAKNNAQLRTQINANTPLLTWREYLLEKANGGDAGARMALRNSPQSEKTDKVAQREHEETRQQRRERLYADFSALRKEIEEDSLLSPKRKYELYQYIAVRQKKVMTHVHANSWDSFVHQKAQKGDEVAKTVLLQDENVKSDVADAAADVLKNQSNTYSVMPNGDVMGDEVLIRDNKIYTLFTTSYNIALALVARMIGGKDEIIEKSVRKVEIEYETKD